MISFTLSLGIIKNASQENRLKQSATISGQIKGTDNSSVFTIAVDLCLDGALIE